MIRSSVVKTILCLAVVAATFGSQVQSARAFCGFYVAGAGSSLYNNATMVVMMREGKRTVLSMQNNYQGPTEDFAMVVPVPVVLQKENVKTLPAALFDRVDSLAAPRLVEYWEQDPCRVNRVKGEEGSMGRAVASADYDEKASDKNGVKIEAQFVVGEYDIVVLSAKDSGGLEKWLTANKYKIPEGAEPLLRPYVQEGMKFFVAKVDSKKVKMKDGQAMLSPLRFHYDDEKFRLPVRLGMINAKGPQDLIVHVLARGKRYEAANFENVTIPTNIGVTESTKDNFAAFYAQLFDTTLEKHPKAIVTEYSWSAGSCDPCPTPALTGAELVSFGSDAIPDAASTTPGKGRRYVDQSFVLTRLHVRYDKASLAEDLVFKPAEPIVGGREVLMGGKERKLERGSRKAGQNTFQARYAIRHAWKGKIECEKPLRGVWGAKPNGSRGDVKPAKDLAFAPRGKTKLASFVTDEIAELGIKPAGGNMARPTRVRPGMFEKARKAKTFKPNRKDPSAVTESGGGCSATPQKDESGWWLLACALGLGFARLRKRNV